MNDAVLVEQTLAGDHQAFNGLITDHYASIYGMILSWVRNPEDAKDLTQDVFISAYLDLPSLREHKQFSLWLRQIARHRCQNWKRKQIDIIPLSNDLVSKEPSADGVLVQREKLAKVMSAIDELPESERKLLKERYLDGIGYDELSARHGISTKALVVRLVRARQKIKDQLEKTLSVFVTFFHRHSESILTGGVEIMKLSIKTKLFTGGILVILLLGGTGIIINNYIQRRNEQVMSYVGQVDETVASTKPVPAKSESSSKSIADSGKKVNKNIDEKVQATEVIDFLDQLDSYDKTNNESVKDSDSSKVSGKSVDENSKLTPEIKRKIEEYAKVADILPRLLESHRKLNIAVKAGTKESAIEIRLAKAEELGYWRQLDSMFPKLGLYQEFNDPPDPLDLWVSQDLRPLVKYFGKELPWNGGTDYLQAKSLDESKISLEEAASPIWQIRQLQSEN